MQYSVQRTAEPQFDPDKEQSVPLDAGWQEGIAAFPLAYAYPEDVPEADYAPGQDAADIEATLLSDLEAAATAFWTDLDSGDDRFGGNAVSGAGRAAAPDRDGDQYEFRWPEPAAAESIGPEPRRNLIAFRPPRARKRRGSAAGARPEPGRVNFDVHATPDGAFADDLAARNKEFYELLRQGGSSVRKIAVPPGPARVPTFETVSRNTESAAHRADRVPVHGRSGLVRQAIAAAVLALIVGTGLFLMSRQFAVPDREDTGTLSASIETGNLPAASAAVGARADSEPPATPGDGKPIDERPTATVPPIDPGTLATPPLYETPEAAGASPNIPGFPESDVPFAEIPLRSTARTESADTAALSAASSAPVGEPANAPGDAVVSRQPAAAVSREMAAGETAIAAIPSEPATAAIQERQPVGAAVAPPAEKTEPGNSRMMRIASGPGRVNVSVNMRAGPDNDARVVRVLRAGTPVEIVACKFWCEVIAGGERGFVYQRFVTRTGAPLADTPATGPAPAQGETPREDARGPLDLLRFVRPAE
jgi:hypothetical protein